MGGLFLDPALRSRTDLHLDFSDDWYRYLWNQMCAGITQGNLEDFAKNEISIVTFNYDLSLEHYLFTCLKNAYSVDAVKANELLRAISISHVYGSLSHGEVGYMSPRTYGAGGKALILQDAASIHIIDEQRSLEKKTHYEIDYLFAKASNICFLGFGFDSVNLARLGISQALRKRMEFELDQTGVIPNVYGTFVGFEQAEIERVAHGLFDDMRQPFTHHPHSSQLMLHYHERAVTQLTAKLEHKSLRLLRAVGVLQ